MHTLIEVALAQYAQFSTTIWFTDHNISTRPTDVQLADYDLSILLMLPQHVHKVI
jgi:hypothetical protein